MSPLPQTSAVLLEHVATASFLTDYDSQSTADSSEGEYWLFRYGMPCKTSCKAASLCSGQHAHSCSRTEYQVNSAAWAARNLQDDQVSRETQHLESVPVTLSWNPAL